MRREVFVRKIKKAIVLFLAGIMAFSLFGCKERTETKAVDDKREIYDY